MPSVEFFMELFNNTYLITALFTWFVQGAFCFGLFVLPRWQEAERVRMKKTEAPRVAKPTPAMVLPRAA